MSSETTVLDGRRFTVSELTSVVKDLLEDNFSDIEVEGEVSNFTAHRSGHWYFTLKDKGAELAAVMFKGANTRVTMPSEGDRIVAEGRLVVYAPRGRYQIVCTGIRPAGKGDLWAEFQRLKEKLEKEGLFDQDRKRPIPELPEVLGIVTSSEAAALQDMLRVLRTRKPPVRVILRPAAVQGRAAAQDIARGIQELSMVPDVEVIVVGRGGGSIEDLWAFNEEEVARAIAASAVPVVSAVGHESDVLISDLVADLRAPTPTAAMDWLLPDRDELADRFRILAERMRTSVRDAIRGYRQEVDLAGSKLKSPETRLVENKLALDALWHRLDSNMRESLRKAVEEMYKLGDRLNAVSPGRGMDKTRQNLESMHRELASNMRRLLDRAENGLAAIAGRLEALGPMAVLERGYAIVFDRHGSVLRDAMDAREGDLVQIRLHRGRVSARVEESEGEGS